jgi:hypothetical protein
MLLDTIYNLSDCADKLPIAWLSRPRGKQHSEVAAQVNTECPWIMDVWVKEFYTHREVGYYNIL